jgi:hypothetical protein
MTVSDKMSMMWEMPWHILRYQICFEVLRDSHEVSQDTYWLRFNHICPKAELDMLLPCQCTQCHSAHPKTSTYAKNYLNFHSCFFFTITGRSF